MAKEALTFYGQAVTATQLQLVTECVARYPNLSRQALADTLCEWFDWRRANGNLKSRECRDFLQQLHTCAVIELPSLRSGRPRGSSTTIPNSRQGEVDELIANS